MNKTLPDNEEYFSISQEERDKIPPEDFAGPNQTYPIRNQDELDSAAKLIGHADNPDEVKKKAIAIAKRKGLSLPDSWKEDKAENAKMSGSDLSQGEINEILGRALNEKFPSKPNEIASCWIKDVYSDYFVYSSPNGLFKCDYTIDDKTQKAKLGNPVAVKEVTDYEPINFSNQVTLQTDVSFADVDLSVLSQDPVIKQLGGVVIKSGRIFKAGDYADKAFKATRKDLANAAQKFNKPVPLDVEHLPSLFDGRLGYLIGINQDPKDPDWLLGTTALTKAASDLLGERPLPVSVVWDKKAMELTKMALTSNPRVEGAAVMSNVKFSKEEINEQAEQLARFIGARHNSTDFASLKQIHDLVATMADGVCAPPANDKETTQMSDVTNANNAGTATQDIAEFKAELAKMQALVAAQASQLANQESQLVSMASERRKSEAASFSSEAVRTGKVTPAAQSYLSALYEQALQDDEVAEKPATAVTFSVKKGKATEIQTVTMSSRAATLKDLITNLPAHNLTEELAKTNGASVLFGTSGKDQNDKEPDGDEGEFKKKFGFSKAEYIRNMNATPQGRAALAKMRANKTGIFADDGDMDETA